MLLKYKQYECFYGNVFIYEDGHVEFIPYPTMDVAEKNRQMMKTRISSTLTLGILVS